MFFKIKNANAQNINVQIFYFPECKMFLLNVKFMINDKKMYLCFMIQIKKKLRFKNYSIKRKYLY